MYNPKAGIEKVRFWCFKVLPLVYDDSLSYYEVLCKMRDKLNDMIDEMNGLDDVIEQIETTLSQIQQWIDTLDTSVITEWLNENLAKMIFVEINDDGYIVYNIPNSWQEIQFNTTGLDINLELQPEYGHLVLSY